jgi:DEAD/DEAH box helicase domain-containing protein
VAQDDPLDQYLVTHPADLFDKPSEAAVIDPTNPYVLIPHLLCAAREQPLSDEEVATYWPEASETFLGLEETGELRRRGSLLHHAGHEAPHRKVDIRSSGGRRFQIVIEETGELLGTVDGSRAFWQVHPGAVYLHQGEQFEVRVLDLDANVAIVTRSDPDYYTQSRDTTDIEVVIEQERARLSEDIQTTFGTVRVTNQVVAFARKHVATGEVLEIVPLDLPPMPLETRAVWWGIPQTVLDRAELSPSAIPGAAHAAEHAAIGLLPLVATCDRWDVGGVSTAYHPDTASCAIFVYDGYQGGAGIAERGFSSARRWLEATLETVSRCPCAHGCPSCVQSPKCGNGNEPLDKAGAVSLLEAMLA